MTATATHRHADGHLPDPAGGPAYRAPVQDILLALDVAGLERVLALAAYAHVDRSTLVSALEEFGRFAAEVIAPTDRIGDLDGAHLDPEPRRVTTPAEFHTAYRMYVDGGWGALPFPTRFGGGAFPSAVALALQEMFASANLALSLNPVLTQGAIEALLRWGDADQQERYLPHLLTGRWSGTMNLTEADAGSDLGAIRTTARHDGALGWRVSGTKQFITWGDHDLAENIVHLVLARTPDAPAGTKGLSLFVVPRRILSSSGLPGAENAVRCTHVEEKLGLHGSPTCTMVFDEAYGELVGPRHGGMRAMFTMMNAARLSIGVQGPAVAERAYQQAHAYATGRVQGRVRDGEGSRPARLVDHLDVKRMLLLMRTGTQASRALLFATALFGDLATHGDHPDDRERARQFADLLTPVAKAWSTDLGFASASLGVQVLGGAGYIEETGMPQRLRDARIGPIYEGTNGIQALDLVTRKLGRDGGRWMRELLHEMGGSPPPPRSPTDPLSAAYRIYDRSLGCLASTTEWMLAKLDASPDDAIAGAGAYLELVGVTVGAWLMLRRAAIAAAGSDVDLRARCIEEAEFFAAEVAAGAQGLAQTIVVGAGHLDMAVPPSA